MGIRVFSNDAGVLQLKEGRLMIEYFHKRIFSVNLAWRGDNKARLCGLSSIHRGTFYFRIAEQQAYAGIEKSFKGKKYPKKYPFNRNAREWNYSVRRGVKKA